MAPASNLRLPATAGRAPGGPRSILPATSNTRPASLWHGPCGCKVIRPRPWNAHTRSSRVPVIWTIRRRSRSFWPGLASVFLWTGDLENAEKYIDATIYQAESYSLGPFVAVGRARKAELAIRRGDARDGVESLQACLEAIHAVGYELLTTEFNISLAQGLAAIGQFAEGRALADRTIQRVEANGDDSVHAGIAAREGRPSSVNAAAGRRRRGNLLHAVT